MGCSGRRRRSERRSKGRDGMVHELLFVYVYIGVGFRQMYRYDIDDRL